MSQRTTKCRRTHKTPKAVAEYMRSEGADVGMEYETHGDVWDAPPEVRIIGLLELILDRLEIQSRDKDGWVFQHRYWMIRYRERDIKLISQIEFHQARIKKMCPGIRSCADMSLFWSIHYLSKWFRNHRREYLNAIDSLKSMLKRLQSVKTIRDIGNLEGIGKKTVERLLSEVTE